MGQRLVVLVTYVVPRSHQAEDDEFEMPPGDIDVSEARINPIPIRKSWETKQTVHHDVYAIVQQQRKEDTSCWVQHSRARSASGTSTVRTRCGNQGPRRIEGWSDPFRPSYSSTSTGNNRDGRQRIRSPCGEGTSSMPSGIDSHIPHGTRPELRRTPQRVKQLLVNDSQARTRSADEQP